MHEESLVLIKDEALEFMIFKGILVQQMPFLAFPAGLLKKKRPEGIPIWMHALNAFSSLSVRKQPIKNVQEFMHMPLCLNTHLLHSTRGAWPKVLDIPAREYGVPWQMFHICSRIRQ